MGFNYAELFTALFLLIQLPFQVLAKKPVVTGNALFGIDLSCTPVSPSALLLNMTTSEISVFIFSGSSVTNSFKAISGNDQVEPAPVQLFRFTTTLNSRHLLITERISGAQFFRLDLAERLKRSNSINVVFTSMSDLQDRKIPITFTSSNVTIRNAARNRGTNNNQKSNTQQY